jgi:hypothetical protein
MRIRKIAIRYLGWLSIGMAGAAHAASDPCNWTRRRVPRNAPPNCTGAFP